MDRKLTYDEKRRKRSRARDRYSLRKQMKQAQETVRDPEIKQSKLV